MPISVIPVTGLVLGPIGTISQTDFPLISPRQVNETDTNNIAFGETFVLNPNNTYSSVKQFLSTNSVAAFLALLAGTPSCPIGIARDAVETNAFYPLNGGTNMPAGQYLPGMMVNGLTKGTISVQINNGTPSGANELAFLRLVTNAAIPAGVVGGIEGVADSVSTTATWTSGENTLTVTSATGVQVGQLVTGPGIPANTAVTGVAGTTITLSQVTTAAGTAAAVTFANTVQLTNIVFKTGVLSTDPNTGKSASQVTILERKVA
jgi:hypothetical protein